jgi:hypothetical protein
LIINNKRHSINSLAYAIGVNGISRKAAFWFAKMAVKAKKVIA